MNKNILKVALYQPTLPIRTVKMVATGGLTVIKSVYNASKKLGIVTGKKACKVMYDKKIQALYEKYKNNGFCKLISMFVWMLMFLYLGNKIYHTVYLELPLSLNKIIKTPNIIGYLILGTAAILYFLKDMLRIVSWEKQDNFKELASYYAYKNETGKLQKLLLSQNLASEQKKALKIKFEYCTETFEILNVYNEVVLSEMDKEAEKIIEDYADKASIGNILSPKLSWNYIITIVTFSKMMLEIAKAYRVKLSISTFFMLCIFGVSISTLAAGITNFIKKCKNAQSEPLLIRFSAWLIGTLCEATTVCTAMSFLGYSIKYVIRPLRPHN